jgi:hypothetical protein
MVDLQNILGQITTALKNNATVDAIVDGRVYLIETPDEVHEPEMPYVVLSSVTTRASNTSEVSTGAELTITLSAWSKYASGPAAAIALGKAIDGVLNVWSNDQYGVIAATRQQSSALLPIDEAWCFRPVYRFLVNGG